MIAIGLNVVDCIVLSAITCQRLGADVLLLEKMELGCLD